MRQWRRRSEAGQTTTLIVGFFLVGALLLAVVVDASAAYLRRQRLDAVADGAALAAVEGIEEEQVYLGGLGERAVLDAATAHDRVAAYLDAIGAASSYPGLRYTVETDADSVQVRVRAPLVLPFAPPGWAERTTVTGTAAAYVQVQE